MDIYYETEWYEQKELESVKLKEQRKIANTLLEYLSSPNYNSEEKIDILLELLYRKNYDKEDFQKYSLTTLKNSINIEFEKKDTIIRAKSSIDMFAIFREDNSFLIANEQYHQLNINKFKFYLIDATTNSVLSTYLYNKRKETQNDLPWRNGSIIKINGINSYVVPISLVIPAKYFLTSSSGIEIEKLNAINDCINKYLAENPLFVENVFVKSKKRQLKDM